MTRGVAACTNGVEAPHREIELLHVRFADHYVTVRARSPQVALQFKACVGPMLCVQPTGKSAGQLDVAVRRDAVIVLGSEAPCRPGTGLVGGVGAEFADIPLAVRAVFHAMVGLFMAARSDLLWLHAGVAAWAGRAFVFPAASGQGKSTLTAELLGLGWHYLSDEIAPIDPVNRTVLPFPVTPHRRIGDGRLLSGPDVQRLPKVRIPVESDAVHRHAVPVESVCFLSYSPTTGATRLTACSPGTAVVQMLRHSFGSPESRQAELGRLCDLMGQVVGTHLTYANARDAAHRVHAAAGSRLSPGSTAP